MAELTRIFCRLCDGTGKLLSSWLYEGGAYKSGDVCPRCGGTGKVEQMEPV